MDILRLPNEVLRIITDHLVLEPDLFHLAQTNRLFSLIAIPRLYRLSANKKPEATRSIIYKAARQGRADILCRAAQYGIDLGSFRLARFAAQHGTTQVFDLLATHRVKKPFNADELSKLVESARLGRQFDVLNHLFDTFCPVLQPERLSDYLIDDMKLKSTEYAQLWLDQGADPCTVSRGQTALVTAVKKGYWPIVNLLLERGARVDDQSGGHAIMYEALRPRRMKVLKALLKHGADPSVTTLDGLTPLRLALRRRNIAAACLLLQKTTTHGADTHTLLWAIKYNSAELVRLHLEAGVEAVPPSDSDHESLLYVAARLGKESALEVLIESGVDINLGNRVGDSPLHIAVTNEHPRAVDVLLRNGADANKVRYDGFAPLHLAVIKGDLEMVKSLIDAGATTNAGPPTMICTPLRLACLKGDIPIVTHLAQHGARIQSLLEHSGDSCLHVAARFGHLNLVRHLLDDPAGAELLNVQDDTGRTALFIAVIQGHSKVVEELLAREADTGIANHFGTAPIFAAVRNGRAEIVEVLLEANPGLIESMDNMYGGHSLLYWAQRGGMRSLIALLRRAIRHAALEYPADAKGQHAASKQDKRRLSADSCDVCARRLVWEEAKRQCMPCCGRNFLMCSECSSNASCLEASHAGESNI